MSHAALLADDAAAPPIRLSNLVWVALALAVMGAVIALDNLWALNFMHVMAGLLWTGIDLFMGFVVGPVLRSVPLAARRAIITRLMPKMLFLLPTLATITGTAGYVLADRMGFLQAEYPARLWVIAALAIIAVLTVQGFGLLLPTNLMVYFELRKPTPDLPRIGRLMRRYVRAVAFQGVLQVAIIVVMARFVTGLSNMAPVSIAHVTVAPARRADGPDLIRANAESRDYHAPWIQAFTDTRGFDDWFDGLFVEPRASLIARETTSGGIVGVINFSQIFLRGFRNAYVGFYGMATFARRGLMTEALRLAMRHAFDEIGLHRVEANIQPANAASIALVRRVGFQKEGFSPRYLRIASQWRDHERWAMLADASPP